MYCDFSLCYFNFLMNYSSDSSYIGFHSQPLRIPWQLMKHSQGFLMLKVTHPPLCFWVNLVFVSSLRWVFIPSPIDFLDASPVEKILPGLTSKNIWNFRVKQAPPGYWNRVFKRKETFSMRYKILKVGLSKMMKNAFYFILKALFVLKIFKFLSWHFDHVQETA